MNAGLCAQDRSKKVTFPDWREPVRLLEEETGRFTDRQQKLADMVGLPLRGTEPRGVVAAALEEHLRPLIWGVEPEPATDRQRAFLTELGGGREADDGLTKRTASAWIAYHLALRTAECLRRLALVRDDVVLKRSIWRHPENGRRHETIAYEVVSSIGADGRVYFRGGNGKCGWPSSLERPLELIHPNEYPQSRELADDVAG